MSLIGLLLLFLIIYFIVVPLVRAALGVRRMRRQWQQRVDDFRRTAGFSDARGQAEPQAPARKKKIDADTGEYIAFEEITVETTTRTEEGTTKQTIVEEQIEDVSWEDIK
ncbi:MAG: hypothetical protein K2M06_04115 [Muribaculaceae bacterium]|nr:hypothetical protein [Muribaculaceae bacterium]